MNIRAGFLKIIIISILISTSIYLPIPNAKGDYEDIILDGIESITITGTSFCENISISEEATLIVEDAYLQVNGIIRMSDSARLFIIRSTLRLTPPPLNDDIHVLHAVDNSMINVKEGSYVFFEPQPTPTNTSYMLLEDYSTFFLVDSTFSGDLPPIINQSIEIASVTAGVYLLSGYSSWHILNSDVEGRLSRDGMELTGRWFWCSLHQRSTLTIEDTDIQLTSYPSSSTLLKPVSGLVKIKNSMILGGIVDCEVTAEIIAENSSFHYGVEFKDQTVARVSNCKFYEKVIIGSALSMIEVQQSPPETLVEIENSSIDKKLTCEANSTTKLIDSTIKELDLKDNATMDIIESTIETRANIRSNSYAEIKDSYVGNINIYNKASVSFEGDQEISKIVLNCSERGEDMGHVSLKGPHVRDIQLYPFSSNSMEFENVVVGNISFFYHMNTTFKCINTSIDDLRVSRTGENVTLNFILINSITPDLTALDRNITTYVYHRLEVNVNLNDKSIEAEVEVHDDIGRMWNGKSLSGRVSFVLPYKCIYNETVSILKNYNVEASYLGFSEIEDVELTSSKTVTFEWVDNIPPVISDVSFGPSNWNLGKEIIVSASVVDSGVISVSSVSLFYRVDDGGWEELRMFKVGLNRYEATIPKQSEIGSISFFISTEDMAENSAESKKSNLSIGQEENLLFYGGFLALIIIISIMLVRKVTIYRKIKKYATKYEFKRTKG